MLKPGIYVGALKTPKLTTVNSSMRAVVELHA